MLVTIVHSYLVVPGDRLARFDKLIAQLAVILLAEAALPK